MNTLRPEFDLDADGRFTEFAVRAGGPGEPSGAPRPPDRDRPVRPDRGGGWSGARGWRPTSPASAPRSPELAGERQPDLVLVNDDDLTYAKIRLDERSLATLDRRSIGEFTESLPAALCWAAAWDMCRDAEMAARDYVAPGAGRRGRGRPTSPWCRPCCARQPPALRRYADPAWRPTGAASWPPTRCASCWPRGRARLGPPARLRAGVRRRGQLRSDLALLAGLLDGSAAIDGLAVDTELRWRLLHRLVSRGAAGRGRDRRRAAPGRHRRGRTARRHLPGRDPGRLRPRRRPGRRSSAARCRTPRSGPR